MALPSIISTNNRVPGMYVRVSLGVGVRSGLDATRRVIAFGNKTASGTGVAGTPYRIGSPDDAATLGGRGSEIHLAAIAAFAVHPSVELWVIIITEAGTAATGTLVFAGTATQAGTVRVYVRGDLIEVAIAVGDTAAVVATAVEAAIDDQTDWPVTAGVVTSTVTVTAKNLGVRGNRIALRAEIVDGSGITVTPPAAGYLTGGATSDNPATAITAAAGDEYYYYALPYDDATNLDLFEASLDSLDEPEQGKRAVYIAGCIDTPANAITLATGRNFARGSIVWEEGSEDYPLVMAVSLAAHRARNESTNPAANMSGTAIPGLRPSPRAADVPTATELSNAINNGLSPLRRTRDGSMLLVRNCTTRTLDSAANPDYRVLDAHKVSVCDFLASDIETFLADRFTGFLLADDREDGEPPAPGVATPLTVRDAFASRLSTYDANNQRAILPLLERVDELLESLVVERASAPAGRLNAAITADVVDHLLQVATDVRQVG